MANLKIIRDSSLRLKLQPEMKARLDALSSVLGVPPSTLGAVWLGQAVASQERSLAMLGKMAETLGDEAGKIMRDQLPNLFAELAAEKEVRDEHKAA